MSNKQANNENRFLKYYRINFLGRPVELNRLVANRDILILNENECNQIIKAYNLFTGYQNLGLILSVSILSLLIKVKMNLYGKIFVSSVPVIALHIYSYFTYWHLIVDLVKEIRKRLDPNFEKENRLILTNMSNDYHNKIESQLGFYNSIETIFKYLFNKI